MRAPRPGRPGRRGGQAGRRAGRRPDAKANAEAEEAKAKAESAQSKTAIVTTCAKAYVSALGALFEGDSVSAASAVRHELRGISDDCANALAGS